MRYEESAGFVVFMKNPEIKFLLLKYPRYWGFPKGLIEKDEKIEETAARELKEETGIEKFKIIPSFKQEQEWFFRANNELVKKKATYFLCEITEEEARKVKISNEHESFAFLSYEEAVKKTHLKPNKEMLKLALTSINSKQRTLF